MEGASVELNSASALPGLIVDQVSKKYEGHILAGSWLGRMIRHGLTKPAEPTTTTTGLGRTMALDRVTLRVQPGEILGILGTNGSGKTTLLRLIAGVSQPTSGTIWRCGKVAALLDLSGGFHPQLNGWQNLFLGASLAGLTRQELEERLPELLHFSGLESQDMDRPVREWSAGMIARLGFSIAVGVDPEIIVVDEVLAVGDAGFQARCAQKLLSFQDAQKTMVMVSHVVGVLRDLCSRLVWLDQGRIRQEGPVAEVADEYETYLRQRILVQRPQLSRDEKWKIRLSGQLWVENRHPQLPALEAELVWDQGMNQDQTQPQQNDEPFQGWIHGEWRTRLGVLMDEFWLAVALQEGASSRLRFRCDPLFFSPAHYRLDITPHVLPRGWIPPTHPDSPLPACAGATLSLDFEVQGHRLKSQDFPVDMPVRFVHEPLPAVAIPNPPADSWPDFPQAQPLETISPRA